MAIVLWFSVRSIGLIGVKYWKRGKKRVEGCVTKMRKKLEEKEPKKNVVKGDWKQLGENHWVEVPDMIKTATGHFILNPEKYKGWKKKRVITELSIISEE